MTNEDASNCSRTVAVTGDLVIDHHLLPDERPTAGYSEPQAVTIELVSKGGAWFLTDLMTRVLKNVFPAAEYGETNVIGPESADFKSLPVAKAYTRWREFPAFNRDSNTTVFRADKFFGCHLRKLDSEQSKQLHSLYKMPFDTGSSVLIIDDLRLGFTENPALWPSVFQEIEQVWNPAGGSHQALSEKIVSQIPSEIIFKMGGPPDRSKLWNLLLHVPELRERMTVLIYVGHLRERGSELSKGLSWDRTIEEIQEEFRRGPSAFDLAWCRRVCVVFDSGSAAALLGRDWFQIDSEKRAKSRKSNREDRAPLTLQRFLYLPDEVEGIHSQKFLGKVFGAMSLIAASLTMHALDPERYPVYIALGRGLSALRHNQICGNIPRTAGFDGGELAPDWKGLTARLAWQNPNSLNVSDELQKEIAALGLQIVASKRCENIAADPAFAYSTTWPHDDSNPISMHGRGDGQRKCGSTGNYSDLLGDFAGPTLEYMYAVAAQIVRQGAKKVLTTVPKAAYGNYLTVDREEIERINAVRSLIETYLKNKTDARPLSIAVFGQPGSGKSFAIKQLLKSLPGKNASPLTFNLSEFPDDPKEALSQLQAALHQVRDQALGGETPLVFWDEFDSDGFKWLKQFLAPMQDGEFREGSVIHPLGRAIFIFAGGTSHSYGEFAQKVTGGVTSQQSNPDEKSDEMKLKKGPDFISRLRGHINVKGPNRDGTDTENSATNINLDPAHIVRRAIILRSLLERTYPQLIDAKTKRAAISESVLRGLLRVNSYHHGARSLESVLTMSQLAGIAYFGSSQLPPSEQLEMHVSENFLEEVRKGELTADIIDPVAKDCYEAYRRIREEMGAPISQTYGEISEQEKESNRAVARLIVAKLCDVGYTIRRCFPHEEPNAPLSFLDDASDNHPEETVGESIQIFEHDRWLREKLSLGFEYCDLSNNFDPDDKSSMDLWCEDESKSKKVRRNWNIQPYADLHQKFKDLDRISIQEIAKNLAGFGYEIVKTSAAKS